MADPTLKEKIQAAQKAAMKARDKARLGAIRLILSEFKRVEVDERIAIDDTRGLAIMDKMLKQRRDSIAQYEDAGRDDLADRERQEIAVIQEFLPARASAAEVEKIIDDAIAATGARDMQDMGPVMAQVKPKLQGRADIGAVSKQVKARLTT